MAFSFSRLVKGSFFLAVAAGAIFALNIASVNSAVKNAAYRALNPIQKNMWLAGADIRGFFEPLAKSGDLAEENERLRARVNELTVRQIDAEALKKENEMLRQGLNLEIAEDFDLKLANIVGKNNAADILIIDKGARDMVRSGMPVITAQRAVAGKILKTYDDFSEVILFTSRDFSFDVKIGDGVDGLVKGRGGYCAGVDLVPKDRMIESGQPIITGGLGGIFPEGLLVGTVDRVDKNDVETFQSATISMAFDPAGARQLFIAAGKYPPDLSVLK